MAITFACEGCGKSYTLGDELAGKTGQCKQCGQRMTIPYPDGAESGLDPYDLDPRHAEPLPSRSAAPSPTPANPARRSLYEPRASAASSNEGGAFDSLKKGIGGALGVILIVGWFGVKFYFRWERAQNRNQNQRADALNPPNRPPAFHPPPPGNRSGPILLPNFPEVGPGREIEPGITLHEIRLGLIPASPGALPVQGGKLWLYLPTGEHPAKSLPCVMITGAGSTLLTGMDLGDGDRPEHLPYVRAGFAVLAFEMDGITQNKENPPEQDIRQAMAKFLNARAGLVNAHVALEFLLKKVPQVDPSRISVAGHSSAAVLSLLFAEQESRLKACIAFAPATDLEKRFGIGQVRMLQGMGYGDLAVRYSPKTGVNTLKCPVFLFHARDDSNVPVVDSEAFAAAARASGKPLVLDVVPSGGHYDSMINEGIPHAINWLNEQGAGVGR